MGGARRQRTGPGGRAAATPRDVPDARRLLHDELRVARREIEAGLRRYTELFELAPVGYFVVGADEAVRDLNFAAARLLGVARAQLAGSPLAAWVAPPDRAAFSRFLAAALVEEPPALDATCELRFVRTAGTAVVRLFATRLADRADAVLLAAEDVTARRNAEGALREESRRKDEFLATLSHELRNPLAPIRNGLGLLARAAPGSEQAGRALAVVERQVGHLSRIVDDLLDVTRLARGTIRLHREPAELGELVRRGVEDHRATFDGAGVALEARLPRDACWVLVDETRFAQVLGSLLANAAKFTAPGGRVEVSARREAQACAVSVSDTGVGIAPEVQERLFEPFVQAPQTLARTRGGLGLGLAMVKGLVELHGGSVSLASAGPGRGAEFTVRLPLTVTPAERRAERAPEAGRRRILVVDDNEDAATTLREVLELSGHDVRVALDGPQAVLTARGFRPEIVVCDIGLPGMDGYAVARALRSEPATREAWLVALTGYALPDDLRRAEEAGFDRHLAKPLGVGALESALAVPRGRRVVPQPRSGADRLPGAGV